MSQYIRPFGSGVRVPLYRMFAADHINISFLYLNSIDSVCNITCCIEHQKTSHSGGYEIPGSVIEISPGMGTLSVYPHRFSLETLCQIILMLAHPDNGFHYMASSNSMLVFIVDFNKQERLAAHLASLLGIEVPSEGFRTSCAYDEIAVSLKKNPETVARYVEEKISTYGIKAEAGKVLCRMELFRGNEAEWMEILQFLSAAGYRFCYASAERRSGGRVIADIVLDSERIHDLAEVQQLIPSKKNTPCFDLRLDLGLISFQGPHFGDRYGIANAVFTALSRGSIPVLLAGCVGASVSVVVPSECVNEAVSHLSEFFQTPGN